MPVRGYVLEIREKVAIRVVGAHHQSDDGLPRYLDVSSKGTARVGEKPLVGGGPIRVVDARPAGLRGPAVGRTRGGFEVDLVAVLASISRLPRRQRMTVA